LSNENLYKRMGIPVLQHFDLELSNENLYKRIGIPVLQNFDFELSNENDLSLLWYSEVGLIIKLW
jgi:hypothetical protein